MAVELPLKREADLLRDALGGHVAGVDDRHEAVEPEHIAREIPCRRGGLRCVAATLERTANVVAHLDLHRAACILGSEAAVTHKLARRSKLDQPQSEAMLPVQ